MNKLLREFEKTSGLDVYGLGAKRVPWEAALEKYAELIVRECADLVADDDNAFDVLKHFGVEE
jgi:hypothetical protein